MDHEIIRSCLYLTLEREREREERGREIHVIGREREEEKAIELHVYLHVHDMMTVHIITTCAPLCLHNIACIGDHNACSTVSVAQ